MSSTPPNHPTEQPGGPTGATGAPGDASGPDVFASDMGPISPPPEGEERTDYHPERAYVGAEGGLGGGDAMGTTTTRTTAGAPVRGHASPNPPANWSGAEASAGAGPAGTYLGPADPRATEREEVRSAHHPLAGRDAGTKRQHSEREPEHGSAAPEHDASTLPMVEAAGQHGWPLPTSGAPTVTGEPGLVPPDAPGGGETLGGPREEHGGLPGEPGATS